MCSYNIISTINSVLFLIVLLILFLNPATAITEIEANPINSPDDIIILIIDRLGSNYIYSELASYAIDGITLPIENYTSIKLSGLFRNNQVELMQNENIVANENDFLDLFNKYIIIVGILLILIINIIGFVLIFKIMKDE